MTVISEERPFLGFVHDFLKDYLPKTRSLASGTVVSYRASLNLLIDYLGCEMGIPIAQIKVEDINASMLSGFIHWLSEHRSLSAPSIHTRLAGIKSFMGYCALIDCSLSPLVVSLSKIRSPRQKKERLEVMSESAFSAVLDAVDMTSKNGPRDHFIMVFLFETGIRIQELIDLKVGDVRIKDGNAYITVHGKGSKIRTVVTQKRIAGYLIRYIDHYHPKDIRDLTCPLFFTIHGGQKTNMSADTPQKFMKRYADMARVSCPEVPISVHPHSLRHLRATSLYRRGIPLSVVGKLLGHVSVDTTQIYATADIEMMRAAIEGKTSVTFGFWSDEQQKDCDEAMLKRVAGLM
jgi:site-specific recombinase XerD